LIPGHHAAETERVPPSSLTKEATMAAEKEGLVGSFV